LNRKALTGRQYRAGSQGKKKKRKTSNGEPGVGDFEGEGGFLASAGVGGVY